MGEYLTLGMARLLQKLDKTNADLIRDALDHDLVP